ncbi:MAG: hypothetical protein GF388_01435 [Candidatus Aegiribacteria sp.]|nr:hypothetical protein [Candidatus Aegiribacteria sp.]MBD3294041.1 hypothetical protein [Candidatus Fermentibacteria bacterium]
MSRGKVYYRFRARQGMLVSAFVYLLVVAVIAASIHYDEPIVAFAFGVVLVTLVVSTWRNAASVTVRVSGDRIIYDYRGADGRKHRELTCEELGDITTRTTSRFKGRRVEQLVMHIRGETIVICPLYDGSKESVQGFYDAMKAIGNS